MSRQALVRRLFSSMHNTQYIDMHLLKPTVVVCVQLCIWLRVGAAIAASTAVAAQAGSANL